MSQVSKAKANLQKIKLKKSIFDENMNVLQRQSKDPYSADLQLYNSFVDPNVLYTDDRMHKIRAKRMVNEVVSNLSQQVQKEIKQQNLNKSRPTYETVRRKNNIPFKNANKKAKETNKRTYLFPAKPLVTKSRPKPKQIKSEEDLNYVYGQAAHSNNRQTVFNPYIHLNSPKKETKYRQKRALETLEVNRVRSEKVQTEINPVSPITSKPNPYKFIHSNNLLASAIPIGPPQIIDNGEEAVVIDAVKYSCHMSTETESLSTPTCSPIPKPKKKYESKKVPKVTAGTSNNKLPGNFLNNDDDTSSESLPIRIQLTGDIFIP